MDQPPYKPPEPEHYTGHMWKILNDGGIAPVPKPKKPKPKGPSPGLSSVMAPLEPLSIPEWESLSGKGQWDAIVGLRGPDIEGSGTLKWFTSSVIRHRLSGIMRVGGLVNHRLPFVILPSGRVPQDAAPGFCFSHFLTHIQEAADWLHIPVCWLDAPTWIKVCLTNAHWSRSIQEALPGIASPFKETIEAKLGIGSPENGNFQPPPPSSIGGPSE